MSMIPPGSTIGIIGGGQLGRMTAMAAASLGYKTHIFCPEQESPATQVAHHHTCADYLDQKALHAFAEAVDVATFEFENIPHDTVLFLEKIVPVHPSSRALHIAQNRIREKTFLTEISVATNRYAHVKTPADLAEAYASIDSKKAVLKTIELGYDGKGQALVENEKDLEKAWENIGQRESILEQFIDFTAEISVIIARGHDGKTALFPAGENTHRQGILRNTVVPATVDAAAVKEAGQMAERIAEALELIGLLAVEFFVKEDGGVLVNEIAPRPHNSGHWTLDGCITSQFEQCIRAICGLPLGSVEQHSAVTMQNLIGDDVNEWQNIAADPAATLHLYGKKDARPGRKMGHVNHISPLKTT